MSSEEQAKALVEQGEKTYLETPLERLRNYQVDEEGLVHFRLAPNVPPDAARVPHVQRKVCPKFQGLTRVRHNDLC